MKHERHCKIKIGTVTKEEQIRCWFCGVIIEEGKPFYTSVPDEYNPNITIREACKSCYFLL